MSEPNDDRGLQDFAVLDALTRDLLAGHLATGEQVGRFQAEARVAARLRHPHIVHIHEAGQVLGQPYFAMEFIEGRSLESLLRQGPVEPAVAATWLAAIARGVAYLH